MVSPFVTHPSSPTLSFCQSQSLYRAFLYDLILCLYCTSFSSDLYEQTTLTPLSFRLAHCVAANQSSQNVFSCFISPFVPSNFPLHPHQLSTHFCNHV